MMPKQALMVDVSQLAAIGTQEDAQISISNARNWNSIAASNRKLVFSITAVP